MDVHGSVCDILPRIVVLPIEVNHLVSGRTDLVLHGVDHLHQSAGNDAEVISLIHQLLHDVYPFQNSCRRLQLFRRFKHLVPRFNGHVVGVHEVLVSHGAQS